MSGPLKSPTPDYDEVVPSKTPTRDMPAVKGDVSSAITRQTVGVVVVSLATIFGAWRVVLSEAKAQTDAGVTPLVSRVVALEQGQAQQRADTHELQVDIRELYKVVQTGRRSERLERPAPPPVAADGGP